MTLDKIGFQRKESLRHPRVVLKVYMEDMSTEEYLKVKEKCNWERNSIIHGIEHSFCARSRVRCCTGIISLPSYFR
jgi:hypothetical protein